MSQQLFRPEDVTDDLLKLTLPRMTPYIPHVPTVKQSAFLLFEGREALYGGAAGGGKSDALLMAALQYVDIPGYAGLILRRTYMDLSLPGALLDRAMEWLVPTDARYDREKHTWVFPSGATLSFGYLQNAGDEQRYKSAEFQYIGFDEVTDFPEHQYRFMFTRLRRLEGVQIPIRMRAATNPIGPYVEWVQRRFLTDKAPGRVYVPASVFDNPHLDREAYLESLGELDPITKRQMLEGIWGVRPPGRYFNRKTIPIMDPDDLPTDAKGWPIKPEKVRYWDLAATEESPTNPDPDYTASVLAARYPSGLVVVLDVTRDRLRPRDVEDLLRRTAEKDGPNVEIHIEQEPGASGKITHRHLAVNVLPQYPVYGERSTGTKEERAKPASAAADRGDLALMRAPWNTSLLDEMEGFPEVAHDDQVDALSGAYAVLAGRMAGIGTAPGLY